MNILNKKYIPIYKKMVLKESEILKNIEADINQINDLCTNKDMKLTENALSFRYSDAYIRLLETDYQPRISEITERVRKENKLSLDEGVVITTILNLLEFKEDDDELNLFLKESYNLTDEFIELTDGSKKETIKALGRISEAYHLGKEANNFKLLSAISNL